MFSLWAGGAGLRSAEIMKINTSFQFLRTVCAKKTSLTTRVGLGCICARNMLTALMKSKNRINGLIRCHVFKRGIKDKMSDG